MLHAEQQQLHQVDENRKETSETNNSDNHDDPTLEPPVSFLNSANLIWSNDNVFSEKAQDTRSSKDN